MFGKGGITCLKADFDNDRYDLLELFRERFFEDDFRILRFDFEHDLRMGVDLPLEQDLLTLFDFLFFDELADFLSFGFKECLFKTLVFTRLKRFGNGFKINRDLEVELFERFRFNFFGFFDDFFVLNDLVDLSDLIDLSDRLDLLDKVFLRDFDFDLDFYLDLDKHSGPVINPSTSCLILL